MIIDNIKKKKKKKYSWLTCKKSWMNFIDLKKCQDFAVYCKFTLTQGNCNHDSLMNWTEFLKYIHNLMFTG